MNIDPQIYEKLFIAHSVLWDLRQLLIEKNEDYEARNFITTARMAINDLDLFLRTAKDDQEETA